MYRFLTTLLLGGALGLPVFAADDVQTKLVDHWKTSKKYLLALADQMPADGYAFKPKPEEMSFGEQLAHIAGANSYFFAQLAGKQDPIGKPANFEKATVVKMLNDSYDFVIGTLEGMPLERMHETVTIGDDKITGMEALLLATDHTAHHRGQCIVYLRAKGIKPTEYKF